jgi:choline dehydrogenase-like flavoprotein
MSSTIQDPIAAGLARGWRVHGGPHPALPATLACDVLIVGSGAGGGVTAELLTRAGLSVVIVEEGPLRSSRDFKQLESTAYPDLYQDSAARKTTDQAINILQGRCVGGSTTVNWTSSFRTPESTLAHWRGALGLQGFDDASLAPWFAAAEKRVGVDDWHTPPNPNNDLLRQGLGKLGITAQAIRRNVKGCWNLGSCGMGCPTNAKQSMLVTTIPAALDAGATLLVETRVQSLWIDGAKVRGAVATSTNHTGLGSSVRIEARHVVVAGGAINSPALLLRSKASDPHALLGTRTFLHPVVLSLAQFDQAVNAWDGAPQTIYSDHFLDNVPIDGPLGYKLESAPMHPLIFATTAGGFGRALTDDLKAFPQSQVVLALMRDGFHPQSVGGRVSLAADGSPKLDYPMPSVMMDAARRALLSMAELQFAAGAKRVMVGHEMASACTSWAQAKAMIQGLDMQPLWLKVVSAHVMGGCAMGRDEKSGVVRVDGTHWQLENLSVHDGSIFPTSIGANPQLSIYGIVNRMATQLAKRLSGRDVNLVVS